MQLQIPQTEGRLLAHLRHQSEIIDEAYQGDQVHLTVRRQDVPVRQTPHCPADVHRGQPGEFAQLLLRQWQMKRTVAHPANRAKTQTQLDQGIGYPGFGSTFPEPEHAL